MATPAPESQPGAHTKEHARVIAPPPLIYLAGLLIGAALERWQPMPFLPESLQRWVAGVFLLPALVVVPAVAAFDRAGTRPEPWKPSTALVTTGPYRYSRNPMYLGFTLFYLAATAWMNSGWALILLPGVLLTMLIGVIAREEAYLERRFGAAYQEYRGRVRRWL
jgi:protein-S-isoprenylcysteine O-methyltransferase Ste14